MYISYHQLSRVGIFMVKIYKNLPTYTKLHEFGTYVIETRTNKAASA